MMQRIAAALLLLAVVAAGCDDARSGGDGAGDTGGGLYIALGDSLSAGVGASDPAATSFVAHVHQGLGAAVGLLNLGHSGDTSQDLLDHGHLAEAVDEIKARNGDGNDVQLVTLEIGGNDLLHIYFTLVQTGTCPDLETSLREPQCVSGLRSALDGFVPNLSETLDRLREAGPDLPIALLTLYNPFGHVPAVGELGDLSLEGREGTPFPEGMNDLIRAAVDERDGVVLVDVYPLFQGRSQELIAPDGIHPNDDGYRVMADAVIEALNGAGVQ